MYAILEMISKKIIIIGITILGIIILLWNFGFFGTYNYLTAKSHISNGTPKKVLIGDLIISPVEMNKVSIKYGFRNVGFGCSISPNEENGIDIYNKQIDKYLVQLNGANWKSKYEQGIDSIIKLSNIPKTAFWIENNGNGNWYNIDRMHNHKNNATISIFDSFGNLITKGHFFIVCPSDELEFMDDLETQIDFYDGQNIQLKSNCYVMKRK